MASIAEVVATAKTGIWRRLSTTPGLTENDGVRVASAAVSPDELGPGTVVVELGDVLVAATARPGLAGQGGTVTVNGWVTATVPEGDEAAIRAARDTAAAVMALVEQAVAGDPTADGTITGPGGTSVSVGGLQEVPVDWQGQAGRRATYPFTVSWTSHTTT